MKGFFIGAIQHYLKQTGKVTDKEASTTEGKAEHMGQHSSSELLPVG